jgi:hypothetical protein
VPTTSTCTTSLDDSDNTCALTTTLEHYDETTKLWNNVSVAYISTTLDFIDSLTASTRSLDVLTQDRSTYNDPTDFYMRWKTTDPLSSMDLGTVYQEFTITLDYYCNDDTVVLNNDADDDTDRTVVDGASAVTIDSAYDGSNSGCDYTAAFEIWDDDLEEWSSSQADVSLVTFDTSTGSFTVAVDTAGGTFGSQSSFTSYTVQARVSYTSTWSNNVSYDEFDLTFVSSCYTNTITATSPTAAITTNDVGTSETVTIPFTAAETHSTCPRTCTFEVWDEDYEIWRTYDYDSGNGGTYVSGDLYTKHPWATVATDGSCDLTIDQEDSGTNSFWVVTLEENRKDFSVRMTVEDTAAQSASITDYFIVSIGHMCSENELEFTTVTASLPAYEIPSSGDGTSEMVAFAGHDAASSVSLSTSDCPLTCNL